jgi:general secretion pathway protein I
MTHLSQKPRPTECGFTLLEAIVALTLLGLALVPMVSFISESADQLSRVAESNERSFATQAAVALLDPINPMEDPEGEESLGQNLTVRWNSDLIIPPNDGPQIGMGLPGFRIGFYDVRVSLHRSPSEPWFEFDLRKVGYQKIAFDPLFGNRNR